MLLSCAAAAPASPPAGSVAEAAAAVARHSDGVSLDDEPQSPRLLDDLWQALRLWSAAELSRRPADPARLAAASAKLGDGLAMKALPLGGGRWLVGGGRGFGTVFVLAPVRGGLAPAWSIDRAGAVAAGHTAPLEAWHADKAASNCERGKGTCGPLQVDDLGVLPADAQGRPRFWILATYASFAGSTVGGQFSLWSWNGTAAEPLVVQRFAYTIEQRAPVIAVDGGAIRLRGKASFDHFFGCGACEERQMEWRFGIDANGVRSEAPRSLVPELDFIDRLLGLALKAVPPPSLAAPAAARDLRALALKHRAEDADGAYYGMLTAWKLKRTGARRELCLGTDAFTRLFTLEGSAPNFRLVAAKTLPGDSCGGPGSRS